MLLSDWEICLIVLSATIYVVHTVYVIRNPYTDLNDPSHNFSRYPFYLGSPADRWDR